MAQAVVLFVGPGQLMFFNDTAQVIIATRSSDQAGLRVAAHNLAVKIVTRLGVSEERTFANQSSEIFFSFRIDFGGVEIDAGRQIDFRLAHMEETVRIPG